jgi:hypothetical protein
MLGKYCSASHSFHLSCHDLQKVTFKEALDDYLAAVEGKRIRAILYSYNDTLDVLKKKIPLHFKDAVVFPRTTAGYMIEFTYKGVHMSVIIEDRGSMFRLCETY